MMCHLKIKNKCIKLIFFQLEILEQFSKLSWLNSRGVMQAEIERKDRRKGGQDGEGKG